MISNSEEAINAMESVLDAPGYPFLRSYKSDFMIDKDMLKMLFTPTTRWLWIVRENGTHLRMIGVHDRERSAALDEIDASLRATRAGCDLFILSSNGLVKVSPEQAIAEVNKLDYKVQQGQILHAGNLIATLEVITQRRPGDGNIYASVEITRAEGKPVSAKHMPALLRIAYQESVAVSDLFVKVQNIHLDGEDLYELLISNQQQQNHEKQPELFFDRHPCTQVHGIVLFHEFNPMQLQQRKLTQPSVVISNTGRICQKRRTMKYQQAAQFSDIQNAALMAKTGFSLYAVVPGHEQPNWLVLHPMQSKPSFDSMEPNFLGPFTDAGVAAMTTFVEAIAPGVCEALNIDIEGFMELDFQRASCLVDHAMSKGVFAPESLTLKLH